MTVYTYKKITYDSLPDVIRESVLSYTRDSIVIDDTRLTENQKTKINEYLTDQGYKLQP
jgi:hypothetical protein